MICGTKKPDRFIDIDIESYFREFCFYSNVVAVGVMDCCREISEKTKNSNSLPKPVKLSG